MLAKMHSPNNLKFVVSILAGMLVFSACSIPGGTSETPATTSTTAPAADEIIRLSIDKGGIATNLIIDRVPAVPDGGDNPYWEILPEYTRATLEGYPIRSHLMSPQIFIYPVAELKSTNETAGKIILSLQALLQSPREIQNMPYLPLYNAAQIMHTHVQYLDFKNGRGLRYLTMHSQGMLPINNFELVYTYQGLTSDGRYYVAAVLPVNHPDLPADGTVTGNESPEFSEDYPLYLNNVAAFLNSQAAESFYPNLIQLDAMLGSLEIQ